MVRQTNPLTPERPTALDIRRMIPKAWSRFSRVMASVGLGFALLMMTGCPRARFVGEYDGVIDQKTTDLAANVAAFGARTTRLAGSPEGTYAQNLDFYDAMHGALAALKMRAAQHEKNETTIEMFTQLETKLESLRKLHEQEGDRGLRPQVAAPALAAIEDQCANITKVELAKRQTDAEMERANQ